MACSRPTWTPRRTVACPANTSRPSGWNSDSSNLAAMYELLGLSRIDAWLQGEEDEHRRLGVLRFLMELRDDPQGRGGVRRKGHAPLLIADVPDTDVVIAWLVAEEFHT